MSPLVWGGIASLGDAGAVLRVLVSGRVELLRPGPLPFGTLLVNTTGAFAGGLVIGVTPDGDVRTLLAVGLLGSFTTFSAWAVQTHALASTNRTRLALLNVATGAGAGLAAAELGRLIAG